MIAVEKCDVEKDEFCDEKTLKELIKTTDIQQVIVYDHFNAKGFGENVTTRRVEVNGANY